MNKLNTLLISCLIISTALAGRGGHGGGGGFHGGGGGFHGGGMAHASNFNGSRSFASVRPTGGIARTNIARPTGIHTTTYGRNFAHGAGVHHNWNPNWNRNWHPGWHNWGWGRWGFFAGAPFWWGWYQYPWYSPYWDTLGLQQQIYYLQQQIAYLTSLLASASAQDQYDIQDQINQINQELSSLTSGGQPSYGYYY